MRAPLMRGRIALLLFVGRLSPIALHRAVMATTKISSPGRNPCE